MESGATFYMAFGLLLIGLLIAFTIVYFAKHRKERIEQPKYSIFDDDDTASPKS